MIKSSELKIPLRSVLLEGSILSLLLIPLFGTPIGWHAFFVVLCSIIWGFEKYLENGVDEAKAQAEIKFQKQADAAVKELWEVHDELAIELTSQMNETTLKMKELTDRVNGIQLSRGLTPRQRNND